MKKFLTLALMAVFCVSMSAQAPVKKDCKKQCPKMKDCKKACDKKKADCKKQCPKK